MSVGGDRDRVTRGRGVGDGQSGGEADRRAAGSPRARAGQRSGHPPVSADDSRRQPDRAAGRQVPRQLDAATVRAAVETAARSRDDAGARDRESAEAEFQASVSVGLDQAVRERLLPQALPIPQSAAEPTVSGGNASRDGDFRDYVAARGRALLRSACLMTGNLPDAEDLVQSALAKTYQAWDRIEDRGALDGYVRRAMINTHISWWRRRRIDEYPTDELPDLPVADHASDSDLHDSLRQAIDRLPQRMRAAVVLRYFEDMTEAEVAEVLGISQGTVKSTVSRAVAKLRGDSGLLSD